MRTGVCYMGVHDPRHIQTDLEEMKSLQLDDVLLAAQENDFRYYTGKLSYTPKLARDLGLRPIAIFWGALNVFGGGRSSLFLLEHPECFQVNADGSHRAQGCYVNPACSGRIKEMIDRVAEQGFSGYFIDEPGALSKCYCPACQAKFRELGAGSLLTAEAAVQQVFRRQCIIDYIADIAGYCKANNPSLEVLCCLAENQNDLWPDVGRIAGVDNLGTDLFWVNNDNDAAVMMPPLVKQMQAVCQREGKQHHEWLQCWKVKRGRENRVLEQGRILIGMHPDAFYVWGWHGQIGTYEASEDPTLAWSKAAEVLREAKAT